MQVIFLYKTSNRQRNEEYKQYEAMKAYYESRGEEVPYQTLAVFRLARRREEKSAKYKAWKYRKADEKQFKSWIEIVGKQNMPETLDEFRDIKYNETKQEDFLLLEYYKKSVNKGDVATLSGFDNYKIQYKKVKSPIIGKTFEGIKITRSSYHFIDRAVDSIYYTYRRNGEKIKHAGVEVENILKVLEEGISRETVYDKKGRASKKFILKGVADVTINPETGELVQVNKDG